MSENFERQFKPELPEAADQSSAFSNVEGESSPTRERMERIINFAGDENRAYEIIKAAAGEDQDDGAKELLKQAETVMGEDYKFSRWPQYFSDAQQELEAAGVEEHALRQFQRSVHQAWLKSIETDTPQELDTLEYLESFEPTFRTLRTSFRGVNGEAFKPLLVEKMRKLPHLGIYDEQDFDAIVERMYSFHPTSNGIELTPALRHGLVVASLSQKMLENKGQPEMLVREYSPINFDALPKRYKQVLRPDTQKVKAVMFTDYTTLWSFEDPEGQSVIRSKKMDVDAATVQQRIDELPDSVPPIKVQFENEVATFYVRYVNGRHPNKEENSPDVPAVKKTIEQLRQLEWYLNNDTHSGNFVIDERADQKKAYWVDQDILDAMVSKNIYSEVERAQAHTMIHKEYPWNR